MKHDGQIISIQIGQIQKSEGEGDLVEAWTSAIIKATVPTAVHLGRTGLVGDQQADAVNHGGPDKAVLAYPSSHYDLWNSEFPNVTFRAGGFGENLTVGGIDESACCIGDTFRVGDCLLQISQPRQPCWKLARRWNLPNLAALVQQNGRTGWYCRVQQEGILEAGMTLELLDRPYPDFFVAWATSVMFAKPPQHDDDLRLAACPPLSHSWRTKLLNRARS